VDEKESAFSAAESEVDRIESEKDEVYEALDEVDEIQSSGAKGRVESDRDAAEFNAQARADDAEAEQLKADESWDDFDLLIDELEAHCDFDY
jgi:hypothetical protein